MRSTLERERERERERESTLTFNSSNFFYAFIQSFAKKYLFKFGGAAALFLFFSKKIISQQTKGEQRMKNAIREIIENVPKGKIFDSADSSKKTVSVHGLIGKEINASECAGWRIK